MITKELLAEIDALKYEIDKTYKEWCGRDFMHLPLSQAVGAQMMRLYQEYDRLKLENTNLREELAATKATQDSK